MDKISKSRRDGQRIFAVLMCVLIFFLTYIFFIYVVNPENKMYFEKASIKATMQKTIEHGGKLSSLKHIYDTRDFIKISVFSKNKGNYYVEDYPLSRILNDLLIDYYKTESKDTVYHNALENLIAENDKKNPFDDLEENQKYHFQNIQEKLDTTYETISPEMIKIADELNNKNQLVTRYLNKSESSFTISIAALFISFIIGVIQLYQNYRSSKKIGELENTLEGEKQQ